MTEEDKEEYAVAKQHVSRTIEQMILLMLKNTMGREHGAFSGCSGRFKVLIGDEASQIPEPVLATFANLCKQYGGGMRAADELGVELSTVDSVQGKEKEVFRSDISVSPKPVHLRTRAEQSRGWAHKSPCLEQTGSTLATGYLHTEDRSRTHGTTTPRTASLA
ncbi:hypothetical protein RB195_026552 [Necator americanus]|uniref:DNA2/NAM7 helicase helicase domain-containing protein n=1 Tax=Necator americanus TaxID=51031 RepID=A0ABR1EXM2_NECAM